MNLLKALGLGRSPARQQPPPVEPFDLAGVDVPEQCRDWRQADVLVDQQSLPIIDDDGVVREVACEHGVAMLSQSCDASQRNRQTVQLARVVALHGTVADEARRGRRPRYAPLPSLGEGFFADLDVVATATKGALAFKQRTPGAVGEDHVRRFAGTAARKVGRFAFPESVVQALRPLQDDLFEKSKKTGSPMHSVIEDIQAFRIAVSIDWSTPPFDLTIHALLKPGAIPQFENDALPEQPSGMRNNVLGGKPISERVSEIAKQLSRPDADAPTRYWSWHLLAEAWGARCEAAAEKAGFAAEISGVTVELFIYDEYTLDLIDTTERLDLDYLSGPNALPND